jgi:hypothetical protein
MKNRMHDLMVKIAKDITACGNVCDTYTKKNILGSCCFREQSFHGRTFTY